MARPSAPSMPTAKQIEDAWNAVKSLHPGARIVAVGPDGVKFDYAQDEKQGNKVTPLKRYGGK